MKILFFISVHGHGRGGHFHSLNHISRKIGEQNDVKIVTIGPGKSNVIESNPHFHMHLSFNGLNFFTLSKAINKVRQEYKPDIYHCFDIGCYNIIRLIISSRKNRIILNKCGGPNPDHFPHVQNLVLFSFENQLWFKDKKKFRYTNIHLIPNRVQTLSLKSDFHPIQKNKNEFVFIRICRIGRGYKKSIYDSINLIELLVSNNIQKVKLFIIGVIEDELVYKELKQNENVKSGHIIFLTNSDYTTDAYRMLYLADAVIGTGRGLMESASLGIPILAIDKNGKIPILLNSSNFINAFKTNFSERNCFNEGDILNNLPNIVRLIQDKNYYRESAKYSQNCFEEYFSIEKVPSAYINVYEQSKEGKRKLLSDFYLILRSALNFYRTYTKKLIYENSNSR